MLVMLLILSVTMLAVVPFALGAGLGAGPVVSQQLVVFTVLFSVLGGIEIWSRTTPTWRRHCCVAATWMVA